MSPKNATTDSESGLRTYRWRGKDYPSVTSLRRLVGMPFPLAKWFETQIVDTAVEQVVTLSAQASLHGPKEAKTWLRRESMARRDRARDLGIRVHEAAASLEVNPLAPVDKDVEPFLKQYQHFLESTGVMVLLSERQIFNLHLGYAGTLDLVVEEPIMHRRVVVDIKTGDGLWVDHVLQLCGYALGEFVGEDDVVDEIATKILHSCASIALLKVRPEGWEWVELQLDKIEARAFKAMVELAHFLERLPSIEPLVVRRETGAAPIVV